MSSATVANKTTLLKRLWGSKVADPAYKECKLLNMMKKDTNFGSEGKYITIKLTRVAGYGSTFAGALATMKASREVRFFVQHKKQYVLWSLQRDIINRSKGDANAVLSVVKDELDQARKRWARASARRTYGKNGGVLARMASFSTVTATLASRADVAAFEADQQIEFASDDGSSGTPAGVRNSGDVPVQRTVQSVNRLAGTVVFTETLATVPSIGQTDFMFWRSDYAEAMTGLRGWNPESAPSGGESFFGLDRTLIDVQRLAGVRVTGSGTYLETIEDAFAEAKLHGAEADEMVLCINPLDMAKLRKELGSNAQEYDIEATVGFKAIKLATQVGMVTLLNEVDVPQGYFWCLNPKNMTLRTAGDFPEDITDTPGGLLVDYTDDAKQGRLGAYGNFTNDNPGETIIGTWP